jgi:hypothetical protein
MLGDTVAGLAMIALLLLFLSGTLQIWHLYLAGAVSGLFDYLQRLAYSASMSAIRLGGYLFPVLRDVEKSVPDYETTQSY